MPNLRDDHLPPISHLHLVTENVKYLRFRVFQKNNSFLKIIQNPRKQNKFHVALYEQKLL
jgi:hypothetical protein